MAHNKFENPGHHPPSLISAPSNTYAWNMLGGNFKSQMNQEINFRIAAFTPKMLTSPNYIPVSMGRASIAKFSGLFNATGAFCQSLAAKHSLALLQRWVVKLN